MASRAAAPVVLDTSVLLNFVKLDRLELLGRVGTPVAVPDQVLGEVLVPTQRQAVAAAMKRHLLRPLRGMAPEELAWFARFRRDDRIGADECAVLAVAAHRGWTAALQDREAQAAGRRRRPSLRYCETEDLLLALIRSGALGRREARRMLEEWAQRHHFASRRRREFD